MSQIAPHASLDDWITRDVVGFDVASAAALHAAADRLVAELGAGVEILGFGEPLHGGEDFLILRNHLFRRLVEAHGYTAIAVESSFSRAAVVDEYVAGHRPGLNYEAVAEAGFSHGFGKLEANRELIEWMREFNAAVDPSRRLRFYGFDSPTEMTGTDSPRQLLAGALESLATIDADGAAGRGRRIEKLLGSDADWENPAAMMDPSQSIGLSPRAAALRVETEELVAELARRRPELVAKTDAGQFLEAARHAAGARELLNYHAGLATASPNRIAELLGIRDCTMAENLFYALERERLLGGKVLAFAHNSHLKRGPARWQLGPHALQWWPAGAHVGAMLGPRYAVIGTGVGASEENGIGEPEAGSLEQRLIGATPGAAGRFIPARALPADARSADLRSADLRSADLRSADLRSAVVTRSGSARNGTYFPLTPDSIDDFDALLVLSNTTYTRGGPPLPPAPAANS